MGPLAFERRLYEHQLLPVDQDEAARIWEDMKGRPIAWDKEGKATAWVNGSQVDRFYENIVHGNGYTMYGYGEATITLRLDSGVIAPIKYRGIAIKYLKGVPRLDYPGKKGNNDMFYEHFMTMSGPMRAAITAFFFSDPEICECIARTGKAPAQIAAAAAPVAGLPPLEPQADNPFTKEAEAEAAAALAGATAAAVAGDAAPGEAVTEDFSV